MSDEKANAQRKGFVLKGAERVKQLDEKAKALRAQGQDRGAKISEGKARKKLIRMGECINNMSLKKK